MGEREAGLVGLGGGISRAAAAELRARAAAPARGRTGSAAAGGAACGAVGGCRVSCRRPAFATMPGIDKLPIEETLEDSPQVRRGRRLRTARGLARAWSLRCPWPRWAAARGRCLPGPRPTRPGWRPARTRAAEPRAGRRPSGCRCLRWGLVLESVPSLLCISREVLFLSR